ncbi:Helicase associated domain protein [Draconibacterium orientale]|uniref:Helicase associated domain protein n=1 Tax=Draconibacterium orientale TaxID=1168034 RepID=UPI002A0A6104|nr:Helicase associated domain protein [Draconibacterium orientale]
MIVEFIGQGIQTEEDETCGNHICSAIKDTSFTQITFFVAFIRRPGLNYLKPFIEQAKKENRNFTFYVGIDEKVTSKEALELLLNLDIETYIYNSNKFIYHPKLYLFEGERNRIITGSSNLTKSGLFYNVESSILLDFTNSDNKGQKVLKQLKEYYSPLLDFTDPNIELLTSDYLVKLIQNNQISIEEYSKNSESDFTSLIHDKTKTKGKNPEIPELGNIKIEKRKPSKQYKSILKITEEYLEKWDFMFQKMQKFYEINKHCTVPREHKDRTLYGWYRKQKLLHKAKLLPKEHFEKLKSINFYFGDGHELFWDKKWMNSYNQLLEIYHSTGDSNVKRHKENTHPLFYISNWVALQRWKYNKNSLKDWQIEKLEKIGFQWNMSQGPNQSHIVDEWLEKLTLLEEYKKENGDCNVSQTNKNPKYEGLGKWLNDQRNNYKKKRKVLTKERIDLLEDLGVVWDMDVYNFQIIIDQLAIFKKENGHFELSSTYKPNPSLGNYVYRIKTKGLKEEWKIKKLHEIGFFEIGTQKKQEKKGHITVDWFKNLEKLKKVPNPDLQKDNKESPVLAKWVHNQRRAFRNGKLKDEQINELKKLGVTLPEKSKKSKRWSDYIELIELFKKEFGDKEITREFDIELFKWVEQQKLNYETGRLRKKKGEKLIKLGIIKEK